VAFSSLLACVCVCVCRGRGRECGYSHQYLSLGELAGGAYRDNYVLVILRENHAQTGLELSGMVAPPDARRAIYALFGDEAHYSLLEPLRAYSPAQPSVFSQAPPALQPELEAVYEEQQAPRSLARRASWQLRAPGSRDQVPLASPALVAAAAAARPPRPNASASGTLWQAGPSWVTAANMCTAQPLTRERSGRRGSDPARLVGRAWQAAVAWGAAAGAGPASHRPRQLGQVRVAVTVLSFCVRERERRARANRAWCAGPSLVWPKAAAMLGVAR
jgi:hypothetical protein